MCSPTHPLLAVLALFGLVVPVFGGDVPLGPEFQANTYTNLDQSNPAVAADSTGNFVIVWQSYEQDDGYAGIYAQRYQPSGARRGTEFQISTVHEGYQQYLPEVSADTAGGFVVTWTSYYESGEYFNVNARRYTADGSPSGAEFQVNSGVLTLCGGDYPHSAPVSTAPTSEFVVTWANCYAGSQSDVFARRFDATNAPQGVEFQVNTTAAGYQGNPTVAHDAAGNFVVVWTSDDEPPNLAQDGDGAGIFAQLFDHTGTRVGTEFQVNTHTAGDQYDPDAAFTPSGDFVVVWTSLGQDGDGAGIFGQRFTATGTRLGGEFPVNVNTAGAQTAPQVTADSAGGFVVVWSSSGQDGNAEGVFGRRFDRNGVPAAREFIANTTTAGNQTFPVVAALSATDFVVAWTAAGQDGSGDGIIARRFARAAPSLFCVADCNHDAAVTVDELVAAMRIALGVSALGGCPAADRNTDGRVTVEELIQAVHSARDGCD